MTTVVIDPGHGGSDPGAYVEQFVEKTYNLKIAYQLADALNGKMMPVLARLTRLGDMRLNLFHRAMIARTYGADLVLAIHVDKCPTGRGAAAYHWPGNELGEAVGNAVLDAMPLQLFRKGRRSIAAIDDPRPECDWLQRPRHVLQHHKATAVLLECGFMDNPSDIRALMNEDVQHGIVLALMQGVAEFLRTHNVMAV
jgi:N-acetylmuramoyl-L-alanine amidase